MNYGILYFFSYKALVLAVLLLAFGVAYPGGLGVLGISLVITLGIIFSLGMHVVSVLKRQDARLARLETESRSTLN